MAKAKVQQLLVEVEKRARSTLYMASLVAIRCNSVFRSFYKRLREAGKTFKVAVVAVMRKLIIILNVMVKGGNIWDASHA